MLPSASMMASSPRNWMTLPTTITLLPTYELRYAQVMRGVAIASMIGRRLGFDFLCLFCGQYDGFFWSLFDFTARQQFHSA
jgi:hypothetical protein